MLATSWILQTDVITYWQKYRGGADGYIIDTMSRYPSDSLHNSVHCELLSDFPETE